MAKEMRNYSIDILGIIEARWNQSGKITLSTGEEVLHLGNENEKDHHTKGGAIMLSKKAKSSLMEWEPVKERTMWVRLIATVNAKILPSFNATHSPMRRRRISKIFKKNYSKLGTTPQRKT